MSKLIVVENPKSWEVNVPGASVVAARSYLTDPQYSNHRGLKVFNLCRSYRYQSLGYYVSLLAMARGHRPIPSVTTIQDMKSASIARIIADDLDQLIQSSLKGIRSDRFTLSIYFGRNMARRHEELSSRLFRLFQAPMLRADFEREETPAARNGAATAASESSNMSRCRWRLSAIRPIAVNDIPPSHQSFVVNAANEFFRKDHLPVARRSSAQFDLAILHNPSESTPPSNAGALKAFAAAARRLRMDVEFLQRDDFGRLAEFDALFIRETTAVHHHTYRFARRAAAEGLVVIDDPESIAKCSNKVYLAELLTCNGVATPKTLIVHKDNRDRVVEEIGLPCILKQPDSAFSQGVSRADTVEELEAQMEELLEGSDLIIAQRYVPTDFDWRIGVIDRQPLFVCKYHMVDQHWQIRKSDARGTRYGDFETLLVEQAPRNVVRTAIKAARLIGDGLYGVDVKQVDDKAMVIEVNDNPNIDAGVEDQVLRDTLYDRVMATFLTRIQQRKTGAWR